MLPCGVYQEKARSNSMFCNTCLINPIRNLVGLKVIKT